MRPEVEARLAVLPLELRQRVEALRSLIGHVAPDLDEGLKWNAPSYALAGQDLITLNIGKRGEVRVVLHRGARPTPAPDAVFRDRHGLADWPSPDRGVVGVAEEMDVSSASPLADLIRDWLAANR